MTQKLNSIFAFLNLSAFSCKDFAAAEKTSAIVSDKSENIKHFVSL
ncbi:MAG: hypothetical protein AB8E15_03090 [Bdellovibrionales bacterium]